jgi:P pilus assembly chaperone PapD
MRYPKAVAIIVILLAIGFCVFPNSASAQGGMMVWPTWVELTVNRGEQAGKIIHVRNQGSESIEIKAYVMDFSIDREGNFVFSEPGHESYPAARWLSVEETELEIAPGESREIEVNISAPTEVEPGGHYAALFFEALPSANQGAVSISTRIPTLFYITVPGITESEVIANADIASLVLPGFAGKGPVEAGVVVHNSGNVHLTVAARAHFSASLGGDSELDLGQAVILPNSDGVIKSNWQQAPFLGKVKASVVIGYLDQKGELVNKSQTGEFWVVPWSLIGIIVGVTGVVAPAILVIRKRYRLRVERK